MAYPVINMMCPLTFGRVIKDNLENIAGTVFPVRKDGLMSDIFQSNLDWEAVIKFLRSLPFFKEDEIFISSEYGGWS
jgi:hypothetical protein